jgi:hypothetical protein
LSGLIIVIVGVILPILGVAGQVDIQIFKDTTSAKLFTAAVGVVITLIGLGVIGVTRFKVETK